MPRPDPKRFERVRRDLTFLPVPPGWVPDPQGEKLWLDELDALTAQEIRQLDRFAYTEDDAELLEFELPE